MQTHTPHLSARANKMYTPNDLYISHLKAKYPRANTAHTPKVNRLQQHFHHARELSYNNMDPNPIDIQKGDTVVGTKKMAMAKIHALSRLQQKDASVHKTNYIKVSAV